MRGPVTIEEALTLSQHPHTIKLSVRAEDASQLQLPEPWVHARALDHDGIVTFVQPERLVRVLGPSERTHSRSLSASRRSRSVSR